MYAGRYIDVCYNVCELFMCAVKHKDIHTHHDVSKAMTRRWQLTRWLTAFERVPAVGVQPYFFFIHSSRCLVVVFRATVSIKLSSFFFAYSGCILKNSLTSSKLGKSEGAEHMKRNYQTKRSSAFFLLFQCIYTYVRTTDIQTTCRHTERQAGRHKHTHTRTYIDTQTHRRQTHRRQTHRRQTHTHTCVCIYIWYMCTKVRTYIRTSIPPLLPSIHPCVHEGRRNLQISHNETV